MYHMQKCQHFTFFLLYQLCADTCFNLMSRAKRAWSKKLVWQICAIQNSDLCSLISMLDWCPLNVSACMERPLFPFPKDCMFRQGLQFRTLACKASTGDFWIIKEKKLYGFKSIKVLEQCWCGLVSLYLLCYWLSGWKHCFCTKPNV